MRLAVSHLPRHSHADPPLDPVRCSHVRMAALAFLLCLTAAPLFLASKVLAVAGTPAADSTHNLLETPLFTPAGTSAWQLPDRSNIVWDDALARDVLEITSPITAYEFAQQDIALHPNAQSLTVSALVRFDNIVVTSEPWNAARIHVTFHDRFGAQLGGWPELAFWSGSGDWAWFNRTFHIPQGAERVRIYAGLHHTAGSIRFGEVIVNAFDSGGNPTPRRGNEHTDTTGWIPLAARPDDFAPSPIDMSSLLHAPAGQHGFLQIDASGSFVFADGTPARFLGVNIVAGNAFPPHEEAERIARRLAKYGFNLVRFHHLDAPWASPNIFSPDRHDTRHLSANQLDLLDYFIYQLQQHGIYTFLDLLVHRGFRSEDGVRDYALIEDGAKVVAHFDPHIIKLQKEYASQLLTHRNPYTGLRYIDDPAVVMVDIINESSLFWQEGMDALPPSYQKDLDERFNAWLTERYTDRDGLAAAWPAELRETEDPVAGTVSRASLHASGSSKRYQDTLRFYYELQVAYFQTMRDHLVELGLQIPVAASNHWQREAVDLLSNMQGMDFLDRHAYWDHPQGGWGWDVTFDNVPAVLRPETGIVAGLSVARTAGLPYTVSEWQHAWPNEYSAEGPLLTTAYQMLQSWDATMQFEFAGASWSEMITGNFDIGNKPHILGVWPAVALMFHRGDVLPAKTTWQFPVTVDRLTSGEPYDVVPSHLPLVSRTELVFEFAEHWGSSDLPSEATATPPLLTPRFESLQDRINTEASRYTSDTNQLTWDGSQGMFSVDTPGTQGAVGFFGWLGEPLSLSDITLDVATEFAVVIVSSLNHDRPIGSSNHLLITTAARAENTGMVYNPARTRIVDPGKAPILMEPVVADLVFPDRRDATVYALDENGQRVSEIPTSFDSSGLVVPLRGQAPLWYEVVFQ